MDTDDGDEEDGVATGVIITILPSSAELCIHFHISLPVWY